MFVSKARYNKDTSALKSESQGLLNTLSAFRDTMAYAVYSTDGQCIFASSVFLSILKYSNSNATSFSHKTMRVEGVESESRYNSFWQNLVNGGSFCDTVARKSASGEVKWLKASYVAISKSDTTEIHAIYHDITELENAYSQGKAVSDALNKSMAVIEFEPDGTIITANENFASAVSYSLTDIKGKHHRMFCRDKFYQDHPNFWDNLARGNFSSGQFERVDANGNALWLEATYNPVFDATGRVTKVIKFASDISDSINEKNAIAQAAELAVSTAEETSQIAEDGAASLQRSVETFDSALLEVSQTNELIRELSEQSIKIETIVTTISGIAEQTNLLALNAAIEAARAGDQGRGFAVVADEVRQLAQRTSSSTVEIESVVAENKKLAEKSTSKMAAVKESVDQNSQQIAQVQGIIDEIQKGALNVSETVSVILR